MITVPADTQYWVDRIRLWLSDTPEQNRLFQVQESSDEFLYVCMLDAIEEINSSIGLTTSFTINHVNDRTLPWHIVKQGATIQVLIGKGILSARNVLTYNDAGGVQVSDMDTYGRYMNYLQVLINKYIKDVTDFKTRLNIANGFGEFSSQLRQDWWTQW